MLSLADRRLESGAYVRQGLRVFEVVSCHEAAGELGLVVRDIRRDPYDLGMLEMFTRRNLPTLVLVKPARRAER